jgi:hypothetical protein
MRSQGHVRSPAASTCSKEPTPTRIGTARIVSTTFRTKVRRILPSGTLQVTGTQQTATPIHTIRSSDAVPIGITTVQTITQRVGGFQAAVASVGTTRLQEA